MTINSDNTRWLMLAMLFACRTGLGLQFQALGSVSTSLVDQLGFNYAQIGTLIGLFMLPGLVLSLPVGYAGRFFADRTLVALGLLSLALGGAIAAAAQGFGLLALGRIAAGAGFVISTIYFTKMVADWFGGRELATAMGALVASWPVGIAIGQIGHVWIAANYDWRMAFVVSAVYCVIGALAVALFYRAPPRAPGAGAAMVVPGLPRNELVLTLLAASVWGLFNAGYIVYLSFAPRVLVAGGYGVTQAAAVISIASWVMIFSIAIGGRIADRTGKRDLVLYVCSATAVASVLLLHEVSIAVWLSLAFGLVGMASAGVIMALTGEAMAPQRRAFGMGVFFSGYFVIMTAAPPIAGWLYDRSGDPYVSVQFAAGLFAAAALANAAFRLMKRRFGV
ncbi:MAG: MFS transporter [Burkholderiales bacterium]|nr:MFS transporter [Burkholderiales bacterium]